MANWDNLDISSKAKIIQLAVKSGIKDLNTIHNIYNKYESGGPFESFLATLPTNQRDTTDYNVRRYWELNGKPKTFDEAVQKGMYTKQDDGWHANSVAYDEANDTYEFMKSKEHPTIKYELDWYNSKDANDFRSKYQLDTTGSYFRYIPITNSSIYGSGGDLKNKLKQAASKVSNFYWHTLRAPRDYSDETTNINECAKYANNREVDLIGKRTWGDAWTRTANRGDMIYSGYDGLEKPTEYSKKEVKKYLQQAAQNAKRDIELDSLRTGDIVGMYFKGSPNLMKAFLGGNGPEAQTHTGNIVVEDGIPYVEHNVHGNIIKNKAKSVLGKNKSQGIVYVYRPKRNGGLLTKF